MGFESGNDSTGTLPTYLAGGLDPDGKPRAIALNADGVIKTSGASGGGGSTDITTLAKEVKQDTEITRLVEIRDRLPASGLPLKAASVLPLKTDAALIITNRDTTTVKNVNKKWRDDFPGTSLSSTNWQIVQTGAGQTITVNNSELVINTGTSAPSDTIIRSLISFTIPFNIQIIANLSQRVNNQIFEIGITSLSGDYAKFEFRDTTTTSCSVMAGNSNTAIAKSTLVTSANTNSFLIFEVDAKLDEINFFTRLSDSVTFRSGGACRNRQIPDPNLEYFLEIRSYNGAAPTSSTTFTIDSVCVRDIEEISATISGGDAGGGANLAIPVNLTNADIFVRIGSGGNTVSAQNIASYYTETTTTIAANATFTGTGRDSANRRISTITVVTDQTVSCFIDESVDNSIWDAPPSGVSCSGTTKFDVNLGKRWYRIRVTAGATAPTILKVYSANFAI